MLSITHYTDDLLIIEDKSHKAAKLLILVATLILLFGSKQMASIWYALTGPIFLTLLAWFAYFRVSTTLDKKSGKISYAFTRILKTTHKEYAFAQITHIGLRLPPAAKGEERKLIQITFENKDALWLSPSGYMDIESLDEIVATIKAFIQQTEPGQPEALLR